MITIFTDGSSKGNPGPGGWGAIVATEHFVKEVGGAEKHTTNNRMELVAAIRALESFDHAHGEEIKIFTDSKYVLKGITEWIYSWQKNNWRTAAKKPVENQDLWQALLRAAEGKNISWKLVAGHAGVSANERCDVIATTFADREKINLYDGSRNGYRISLEAHGSLS